MKFRRIFVVLFVLLVFQGLVAMAQLTAPTRSILTRVLMVESQHGRGTTFSIDVDQREYWITAKHILTGAKHPPYGSVTSRSATLRILNPDVSRGEQWLTVNFSVIDAGNNIDIVVLAAPEPILKNPVPSMPAEFESLVLGSDCEFLGFPYGGGWPVNWGDGQSYWMPFVKHCSVSAMPNVEPRMYVLDGLNNDGFSGGPVIFGSPADERILGVVSGYYLEPTEVVSSNAQKIPARKSIEPRKPKAHLTVNLNSGFVIAYPVFYAMKAILENPIGPLRQ